jgi:hypothetical protein
VHPRQQRVRVLEALEARVKQFRSREEIWPLRVPHEPVPLDAVIEEALGDEARRFDAASLRSRTVLHMDWDDGSRWDAWVIVLPSQVKVFCDSGAEEARILASGGRNEGDETDRLFLERLAESAGADFGIEMSGGPPAGVRSSIADRRFLVDMLVTLFEVTGMEDAVREALRDRGGPSTSLGAGPPGHDFRSDVEEWLQLVTRQ